MAKDQIGLVNAFNELCDNEITTFQNDSFIPVFRKNGSENIVEKFLGKNLPSGGSSSSIKNVIVINPNADEVVGKVYNSFAHAKDYIDRNVDSSIELPMYKIELPAGEFDEQITISKYYEIHGNSTILTSPIKSDIIIDLKNTDSSGSPNLSDWFLDFIQLSNCIINGGFVDSGEAESAQQFYIYPNISNCAVKRIDIESLEVVISGFMRFIDCVIDVEEYGNTTLEIIEFMNCRVENFKCFSAILATFNNCVINNMSIEYGNASVAIINCGQTYNFENKREISIGYKGEVIIYNSYLNVNLSTGVGGKFILKNSTIEGKCYISGNGSIEANPTSSFNDVIFGNNVTDNRCYTLMFSPNDGETMFEEPDKSWETTYIGICKNNSAYNRENDQSKYFWFKAPFIL